MKIITAQVVVKKIGYGVLFKTESLPANAIKRVYDDICKFFPDGHYEINLLKTTTYIGYAQLHQIMGDRE